MVKKIVVKSFKIPSYIFYIKGLKTSDKLVYMFLCGLADKDNKVSGISQNEIAKRCSLEHITVRKCVYILEDKGLIAVERKYTQGTYHKGLTNLKHVYTILDKQFNYNDIMRCGHNGREVLVLKEQ